MPTFSCANPITPMPIGRRFSQARAWRIIQISEFPIDTEGGISRVARKYASAFEARGWVVKNLSASDFRSVIAPTNKRIVSYWSLQQELEACDCDLYILHGTASIFVAQ